MIDHFKKCEKLTTHYSNTAVSEITYIENHFLEVEIHNEVFYCTFFVKGKCLWICVVSQSPREKLDKFNIEVSMGLDKTAYKKHKLQKLTDYNNNYDWREKFIVNNNGPYNIELNIKKTK